MNFDYNYRLPVFLAIALHLILFLALFIHFANKSSALTAAQPAMQIINATVVNQNSLSNLAPIPTPPKPVTKPQPEPKPQPEKPAIEKQQEQQIAKEKVVAEQAALKKQAEEKIVEQKHLLAEHLQQELAAEQKKAKAKQKLAAKKAAEQAAKQLLQQELAANPTEEPAAQSSKNDSKAEAKSATQSAQNQGEIDKYKTLIIQAISQKWIVPDNVTKGLEAKLLVTLAPGGMVVDVKIIKSSGDAVLDRSAQTAVYKASPLPVPADSALFNKFRVINLIVRPEGILTGG